MKFRLDSAKVICKRSLNKASDTTTLSYSTKHIGYLERDFLDSIDDSRINDLQFLIPEKRNISFIKIKGISRFWKQNREMIKSARQLMKDVISGIYGQQAPLIYLLIGMESRIDLFLGTVQEPTTEKDVLSTLSTSLRSAYPGIEISSDEADQIQETFQLIHVELEGLNFAGIITGTPTPKVGGEDIGVGQIERLIRGLYGNRWAYILIASPIEEEDVSKLYNAVINELRTVANSEKSNNIQSPIAEKYKELLEIYLKKLQRGKATGMFHTSAYVLTEREDKLLHAMSVVRAIFAGDKSRPDPIKTLYCDETALKDIKNFGLLTTPAPDPIGQIKYPFKYLSLLNVGELSSMAHLPLEEFPGYYIRDHARFDVSPRYQQLPQSRLSSSSQTKPYQAGQLAPLRTKVGISPTAVASIEEVSVGDIIHHGNITQNLYHLGFKALNKHTMIVGTTGSGKTNTIFNLIRQLWAHSSLPFLVIEPAKTEYRKLMHNQDLSKEFQIFTLGDENVSPFRLNPFEILPGVSVQSHITYLNALFNASFVMYAPMPYVLERCIHEIYEDKGWNLVTNDNRRGVHENAYPTLTDLYNKIDEVTDKLGYEDRITMDVKAALKTRVNSLRIGGKGLMLDTKKSVPIEMLLGKPTILELEQIGDDDEKSFLIGLLFTRLYEYYVSKGLVEGAALRHLTIVEEAHRLLKNVPEVHNSEMANMKSKAVETFCNMLSEVRAYGEGFIIAEQIPSKLATDIIKNTNVKIMHRIVSEEDRALVGASMNFNESQFSRVTSLKPGEGVVYSEGDDGPFLVKVPYSKLVPSVGNISRADENQMIRELMEEFSIKLNSIFRPYAEYLYYSSDLDSSDDIYASSESSKGIKLLIDDNEFQEIVSRFIISTVLDEFALVEQMPQVLLYINKFRSNTNDTRFIEKALIYGIDQYFERRGSQYGWKYSETEDLKRMFINLIKEIVIARIHNGESGGLSVDLLDEQRVQIKTFQQKYKSQCRREFDPYPYCSKICPNNLCVYRYSVAPFLSDKRISGNFTNALGSTDKDSIWHNTLNVCYIPVRRALSENSDPSEKRKAALCFGMQKTDLLAYFDSFLRNKVVENLIAEAEAEEQEEEEQVVK